MDPLRKNLPGNHEDDAGAYLPMPEEIELAKLRLRRKHLADKLAEKSTHYASEPGIRYCRVSNSSCRAQMAQSMYRNSSPHV